MAIDPSARLIFGSCALLLLAGILQMIRRGMLKEKYALLWLPVGVFFAVFAVFPEILVWTAAKVHLHYITVVLLCVILVFTLILLYFTMRISQLREDLKKLAQEMALLRAREPNLPPVREDRAWTPRPVKSD